MIFVTVGTQLPFERLVLAMDEWAKRNSSEEVFAQTGPDPSTYLNLSCEEFVMPDRADELFRSAELIVSHAGMGSILTAQKYRKPIIIVPRKASLGEHRNEHQRATAKWLGDRPGVSVAWEVEELIELLDRRGELAAGDGISEYASPELLKRLGDFIAST